MSAGWGLYDASLEHMIAGWGLNGTTYAEREYVFCTREGGGVGVNCMCRKTSIRKGLIDYSVT